MESAWVFSFWLSHKGGCEVYLRAAPEQGAVFVCAPEAQRDREWLFAPVEQGISRQSWMQRGRTNTLNNKMNSDKLINHEAVGSNQKVPEQCISPQLHPGCTSNVLIVGRLRESHSWCLSRGTHRFSNTFFKPKKIIVLTEKHPYDQLLGMALGILNWLSEIWLKSQPTLAPETRTVLVQNGCQNR